jgi:hypothetical protein
MIEPEWEYARSVYLPKWHYTAYRDDGIGVEMRVYTRRTWMPFLQNHKEYFFIDGFPKVYTTQEKLLKALDNQKAKKLSLPSRTSIHGKKAFAH